MPTIICLQPTDFQWQPGRFCSFSDDLAVFRLALPDEAWAVAVGQTGLTEAERDRAGRYHRADDRVRFVGGRWLIRFVIGQYLGQLPGQVEVGIGPGGKLFLPHTPGLHLNLTHAGGWILLAVSRQPVGVDIEIIDEIIDYQTITRSSFSLAEQRTVAGSMNPRRMFYDIWTRKEAVGKAIGTGISNGFADLPGLIGTHVVDQVVLADENDWTVRPFAVDGQHPAALGHRPAADGPFFYDISPTPLNEF